MQIYKNILTTIFWVHYSCALMVTIANANFPDSDHEDEDFEVPGGIDEPADTGAEPSSERPRRRKRHKSTEDLWKEMQQDEMESAKSWIKRPCPDPGLFPWLHGVES